MTITEFRGSSDTSIQSICSQKSFLAGKARKEQNYQLMVPVNLSKDISLQDDAGTFSLYVLPGIDTRLGDFSFDENTEGCPSLHER